LTRGLLIANDSDMGQLIDVTIRPGTRRGVRQFECNRSLTGMEIERYAQVTDATGDRPPDILARRLFDIGATAVTVYSSAVTVEGDPLRLDQIEGAMAEAISHLFVYYDDERSALAAVPVEADAINDGA